MCVIMFSDAYSAHVTYEVAAAAEFASVTVAVAAVQQSTTALFGSFL